MEAYIPKHKTRLLVLSGILLTYPLLSFAYNYSYITVSIPQNQTTTGPIIYSVSRETRYVNTYSTSNSTRPIGSPAWSNGEWAVDSQNNYEVSPNQPVREYGPPAW